MGSFFGELKRRNVVRVGVAYIIVGWVVVQISQVLFEAFGTPDWVIKTVIVLIAIGFPFALLFAWAFEITPEGVKKTRDVDLSSSITPSTGKRLNFVIMASLVIALGYFIWERQTLDRGVPSDPAPVAEQTEEAVTEPIDEIVETTTRSIAVLPFVNMSSDQDQEWFADGLTEEILNSLARTPDLLVAARTSSFGFKGSTNPVPEIAASLGVDHVLEGSVRRGGDTVRITAQLIRAMDGFHLWSETYDRTMDDIISIQEEIAIQIANALETAMDPEALAEMMDAGTSSVPAYEAYLKGIGAIRAASETGDPYEALNGLESFEGAIELDPGFSKAYAWLSFFWTLQVQSNQLLFGITDEPIETRKSKRDDALEKAILYAKDSTARLNYQSDQAWNALNYRRALRLKAEYVKERPNDQFAFGSLVTLHRDLAMHEQATALIKERYEQTELTQDLANLAMQSIRTVADAEFMRIIAHDTIDKFGDDVSIMYQAHRLLLWAGDIDGASSLVPKLRNSDLQEQNRYIVELRQACAERRSSDATKLLESLTEKHADDIAMMWLGHQIFGDTETAAEIFDEYDQRSDIDTISTYMSYAHFDPSPYPNFVQAVAGQGIENRVVLELPYRCNRP